MVIRGRWPPLVDGRLRNANDTLILQTGELTRGGDPDQS